MRRRKSRKLLKLLGIGVMAMGLVAFVAAFAMADPDRDGGAAAGPIAAEAQRAGEAAAALADAHPQDRAVSVLAGVVEREIEQAARDPRPDLEQLLSGFSDRAEEHLVAPTRNPGEAQQLLRNVVQQLRTGPAAAPQPAAQAEVGQEITAFGRDVEVPAGAAVAGASVMGGDLTVRGHVLGDAVAMGGNVKLESGARVDGDVVSFGGNLRLEPGSHAQGDTVAVGGHTSVADGAYVGGDRTQMGGPAIVARSVPGQEESSGFFNWVGDMLKKIGLGIVMALLCIVIAALAPDRTRTIIATIRRRPGMSFISGMLAFFLTGAASVLLGITILGIPLIPVLWIGVALGALVGTTGVACLVGEVMPGKMRNQRSALWCIVLGVAFLTIVSLVPLGWLLLGIVTTLALGAVILSRIGAVQPPA